MFDTVAGAVVPWGAAAGVIATGAAYLGLRLVLVRPPREGERPVQRLQVRLWFYTPTITAKSVGHAFGGLYLELAGGYVVRAKGGFSGA